MAKRLAVMFFELFKIALFVVGGGLAIIAVAEEVFAKKLKWTKPGELMDHLPVFQMVPGLIAGNTAVYIGRRIAGWWGAAIALVAIALPSLAIFTLVSAGYDRLPLDNPWLVAAFTGLRASLTGVVLAMLITSWRTCVVSPLGYATVALGTAAILVFRVNTALVLAIAALAGLAAEFAPGRRGGVRTYCSIAAIPLVFLKYGLLCIGGGYVLVPMYIEEFVGPAAPYLQLPAEEFSNLMALTQMTPGPIGINAATFFGYRLGGVPGAALATAMLLLPGYFLLMAVLGGIERFRRSRIVKGLLAGIRPATIALMLAAFWAFAGMSVWGVGEGHFAFHPVAAALCAFTTVMIRLGKLSIMALIFLCAGISVVAAWL